MSRVRSPATCISAVQDDVEEEEEEAIDLSERGAVAGEQVAASIVADPRICACSVRSTGADRALYGDAVNSCESVALLIKE